VVSKTAATGGLTSTTTITSSATFVGGVTVLSNPDPSQLATLTKQVIVPLVSGYFEEK